MKRSRPTRPKATLMMSTAFHSYEESQRCALCDVDMYPPLAVVVVIGIARRQAYSGARGHAPDRGGDDRSSEPLGLLGELRRAFPLNQEPCAGGRHAEGAQDVLPHSPGKLVLTHDDEPHALPLEPGQFLLAVGAHDRLD